MIIDATVLVFTVVVVVAGILDIVLVVKAAEMEYGP